MNDPSAPTHRSATHAAVKPRLLCVDDEPHVVEGLALQLRKRFQVSTSTSPRAVIEKMKGGESWDAIVSDLRMPDVSGVDLLREVRKLAPGTARILLTGYGDFSSAVAAVNEAAVHRFLTKPCRPDQLSVAIDEALLAVAEATHKEIDLKVGKLATLGTMAGSIGHEVGNLVNALNGSIALVRAQVERGALPTAEEMVILETVKQRIGEHASHLKNLAKPRPMKMERLDLDALVRTAVQLLEVAGILRGLEVRYVPPTSATVHAVVDHSSLEGVVVNLLKNAAEAVNQRAEKEDDFEWSGRLTVVVATAGEHATISVEDNGCGMPPEVQKRVFERFFTTKAPGKGTGLGLAIASQTMKSLGGTISVESEENRFTRFTLTLEAAR